MFPSSPAFQEWVKKTLLSPLHIILIAIYFTSFTHWILDIFNWLVLIDLARQFLLLPRPIKSRNFNAIIVGAGASGLCMAKRFRDVAFEDFVVLEKAQDLGGTWLQNKYPGVACDITSHFYCFSFHYNPFWSRSFSGGQEIWKYFKDFAESYGLNRFIRFNVKVTEARWDGEKAEWRIKAVNVKTGEEQELTANFFIGATGALHVPNVPKFNNQNQFQKKIVHANDFWDGSEEDFSGKKVGIIGTGATAVQIVPEIAEKCKEIYLFQRTPAWAIYRKNFSYFKWVKTILNLFPFMITFYRWLYFILAEISFQLFFFMDRRTHDLGTKYLEKRIKKLLKGDEKLSENLIPDYGIGCKRITPSQDYLTSFLRNNVHLITNPIESFTQEGIKTQNGDEFEVDFVILATGFDLLANCKPFLTFNQDQCQEENWADEPRAYLGVTHPGFPNKFNLLGPGSGLGHSSIIFVIECQVNYVLDCIRNLSEKSDKLSIDLKPHVFKDFIEYLNHNMSNKTFNGKCFSWYKNARGVNWTLWPNDLISYWYHTYSCAIDDYIFE